MLHCPNTLTLYPRRPHRHPQVCSGRSGHTEAVQLVYRPAEVSFDELCTAFLNKIDPKQAGIGRKHCAVQVWLRGCMLLVLPAGAGSEPVCCHPACLPPRPQKGGQGNDIGSQYRTGIYWHDDEQQKVRCPRACMWLLAPRAWLLHPVGLSHPCAACL